MEKIVEELIESPVDLNRTPIIRVGIKSTYAMRWADTVKGGHDCALDLYEDHFYITSTTPIDMRKSLLAYLAPLAVTVKLAKPVVPKQASLFERCYDIAQRAHQGQRRENGQSYITHPMAVAETFSATCHKCLAILHDTLEDTVHNPTLHGWVRCQIEATGLGSAFVADLELLTKIEGESYFDFIMRLVRSGSTRAMSVKIADINHNLSDAKPGARADKYRLANHILATAILEKGKDQQFQEATQDLTRQLTDASLVLAKLAQSLNKTYGHKDTD